ncbi:hypothetical protein WR25_19883 [Diploscapter pachys]|uniref:Sulfotransferase domain-containing protein n=1 Tax=Diploscapter pachys TaxID=2018661 RepID=A0A2A2LB59_9BILA|nr:hypothetical protein WR25_19883 [Diploscapter pachys]
MSTVMTGIICYLHNAGKFVEENRDILKEWKQIRFCMYRNEFLSLKMMFRRYKMNSTAKGWKFLMVTRDPVDRFLSGFVDKCIRKPREALDYCNGCGANMTCFIIQEYERMKKQVEQNNFYRSFEDRHFFPQNWRCNLDGFYDRYNFIRYSSDPSLTLMEDLFQVFREQKVPDQNIEFIRDQLTRDRTIHSTIHSEARMFMENRLRSSPFLMEYIVRMFYQDFILFNYTLPTDF